MHSILRAPLAATSPDLDARHLARRLGHPALLAGTLLAGVLVVGSGAPLGPSALVLLLAALAYLFAMERFIPYREAWTPTRAEWRRDLFYFGVNGLVSTGVSVGATLAAIRLTPGSSSLPLPAQVGIGFLSATFVGYWAHRLGHEVHALWQLHGVHHAPDKVNTWNNNVIHFADLALQSGSSLLALLALGLSPEAVFLVSTFRQVLGFLDHANADFRIGRLNYWIGSPEQHRLHHSVELEEAGCYSGLPLWDRLFGTFTWRPDREVREVGIVEPESFPSPDSVLANAVHPVSVLLRRAQKAHATTPSRTRRRWFSKNGRRRRSRAAVE